MDQTETHGTGTVAKVAALALLAGVVVLLLLFPSGGVDSIPPRCSSIFNLYSVPCDGWLAAAAGAATAGVVGVALRLKDRRR